MSCVKFWTNTKIGFVKGNLCIQLPFPVLSQPTNKLSRFVGPLINKGLKGLLHRVDETLIACEAALCHVVHLVLEVQQVLHHVLVFFWSTYDLSTKGLRTEKVSPRSMRPRPVYFFLCCVWTMCIPLCNPSRTAAVWEVLLSPCWRAGRGGSAQSLGSHPAGCSDLAQKYFSCSMCWNCVLQFTAYNYVLL